MNNTIKKISIISGLIVFLIITFLVNNEAGDTANNSTYKVHRITSRVQVNTGIEKTIHVTYKLLKSIH